MKKEIITMCKDKKGNFRTIEVLEKKLNKYDTKQIEVLDEAIKATLEHDTQLTKSEKEELEQCERLLHKIFIKRLASLL